MTPPFYQKTPIVQSYVIISPVTMWWTIASNALWILGLAVTLAALSYHYGEAAAMKQPLRQQLQSPSFQTAAWIGLGLVCLGLGSLQHAGWQMIGWFVLAGLCWLNGLRWRPWRRH